LGRGVFTSKTHYNTTLVTALAVFMACMGTGGKASQISRFIFAELPRISQELLSFWTRVLAV